MEDADHEADEEQSDERQDVLRITHGKREVMRHEERIECQLPPPRTLPTTMAFIRPPHWSDSSIEGRALSLIAV